MRRPPRAGARRYRMSWKIPCQLVERSGESGTLVDCSGAASIRPSARRMRVEFDHPENSPVAVKEGCGWPETVGGGRVPLERSRNRNCRPAATVEDWLGKLKIFLVLPVPVLQKGVSVPSERAYLVGETSWSGQRGQ